MYDHFKVQFLYCNPPPSQHCQDHSPVKTLYPVWAPAPAWAEEAQRWVGRESKANKTPSGDRWDMNVSTRSWPPLMEKGLGITGSWRTMRLKPAWPAQESMVGSSRLQRMPQLHLIRCEPGQGLLSSLSSDSSTVTEHSTKKTPED